jgi:hypothetical protein
MNRFCELTEYQLLELQENLKTIFMIKKNNYIRYFDDEEIEEINIINVYLKKYQINLKI